MIVELDVHYYLDTSSVRSAGRKLADVNFLSQCFTSALTLVELINGLRADDRQFALRSGCIRNIQNSGLQIEWNLPETMIASSFDELVVEEKRIESLKRIIACSLLSKNLTEFAIMTAEQGLSDALQQLEEYDSTFGLQLIQATRNSNIRQVFESYCVEQYPELSSKINKRKTFKVFCNLMKNDLALMNNSATIYAYAVWCATRCFENLSESIVEHIYDSYNGTIDLYIRAWSYAMVSYEESGRTVQLNDAADLTHFLYLKPEVVLVTEEKPSKIIRRTAEGIGLTSASIEEMLAKSVS